MGFSECVSVYVFKVVEIFGLEDLGSFGVWVLRGFRLFNEGYR